jgi:hypothetical protein
VSTPRHWPRIEAILDAALRRPISARRAFVREAAASDAELAAEIERLLAECDAMGDFLEPRDAEPEYRADVRAIELTLAWIAEREVRALIAVLRSRA